MIEPVSFDRDGAERIARAVRLVETNNRPRRLTDLFSPLNWQQVRCTGPARSGAGSGAGAGSAGAGSGSSKRYYPGQVELWDASAEAPEVLGTIWILDRNKGRLIAGQVYNAAESGSFEIGDDRRPLFTTAEFGTGYDGAGSDGTGSGDGFLDLSITCANGVATIGDPGE